LNNVNTDVFLLAN